MQSDDLPPSAQAIAEVIGREKTLQLAAVVNYRSLYVPYTLPDNHWIAHTIGIPAARKLRDELGGLSLPLAKCRSVSLRERDNRILEAYKMGVSKVIIASLLGMSVSGINHALNRGMGKGYSWRKSSSK